MRRATIVTGALAAALIGCGSNEPEPAAREKPPTRRAEPAETPEGVLAPVDAWRRELEAGLAGTAWSLQAIDSGVEAPPGYTRLSGGRGLKLAFGASGGDAAELYVMPRDFSGMATTDQAAQPVARSEELMLYAPSKLPAAWGHTPKVAEALGMKPLE